MTAASVNLQRTNATRFGWRLHDTGGNILSSNSDWRTSESSAATPPLLILVFY